MQDLADWMRAFRKQLGLTQGQIAERLGVTLVTINRWENRQGCPSRLARKQLMAFAQTALGTRSNTFAGEIVAIPEPRVMRKSHSRVLLRYPVRRGPGPGGDSEGGRPRDPATEAPDGGAAVLRRTRAFADLDEAQIVEVSRSAVERQVNAGHFFYFEDEVVGYVYIVAEGRVKIFRHSPSGKDFVLAFCSQGDTFGNLALLSGKPHPASVQAVVDTRVLALRTEDILSFILRHRESGSRLLMRMLETVGMRQLRATRRLADMAVESVDRRVTYTLLSLSLELGAEIPFTRQEIAEMSGTTTESTIRFIHILKQRGIVRPGRHKLTIVDQEKLGLLSDGYPIVWDSKASS